MGNTLDVKLQALNSRQQAIAQEVENLGQTESSDEEKYGIALNAISDLNAEFDKNEKEIEVLASAKKRQVSVQNAEISRLIPADAGILSADGSQTATVPDDRPAWDKIRLPAQASKKRSKVFDNDREAYFCGLAVHAMCGSSWAANKLADVGFNVNQQLQPRNAMEGGTDSAGGYATPQPMAAEIIRLVEEFGVFRQNARVMPMTANTLDVPKRAGGVTVVYPAEGASITASDITFSQVNLVAKKYAALAIWSTELNEDAVISMTDLVTQEIAFAIAKAEDENSFLGDGTATYGSITGIKSALAAGAKVTGAASWGAMTLAMYHEAVGKLKWYSGIQPAWYVNHEGFAESFQKLLYAAGGNTTSTVAGGTAMEFLGYPVIKTQAMPRDPSGSSELIAVLGDLSLGTMMGARRDLRMQILRELYAVNDQLAIVATSRSDTVIHDIGTATEAGSIVGIYSPA